MCAALVEKATNIAGIARTCEIFAVEELIISDLRVMQSDDFKGISVNAGDWLQIKEVSSSNLVPYLISMKTQGYVIVGLEQTDSSMSMLTSTLPNKCVLLLGKEKEGIPVELLQLVDICIEIPQFGVTRSLNVHVSAALLLWEVTKQNKEWLK
jgi:tRNA G18 (ribose-2'-O)-methylase SpoU